LPDRGTSFVTLRGIPRTNSNKYNSSDAFFSSETSLELETRLRASLKNRFFLYNLSVVGGYDDFNQTSLEQYLTYTQRKIKYTMKNSLDFGDDLEQGGVAISNSRGYGGAVGGSRHDVNYVLNHESAVQYYPLHNFKSKARFTFSLYAGDDDNSYRSKFNQSSKYTFYSNSGHIRELGSVYQEASYEKNYSAGFSTSYFKFSTGVGFFPYRFLELGGDIMYEYFDPFGAKLLTATTAATFNFEKLVCEVIYSYGMGKFDDRQFDERTEHVFEAKVKRIF
jgi:hypothetical protein